jgi:uncharacterized protein YlxP (DUF503 family)
VHVLALAVDVRLAGCRSLKDKRAVLRPVVDGCRARFHVSVAETGHQQLWQRAEIGAAVVSGSARVAREVIDDIERFIWSFPELEVIEMRRFWLDEDSTVEDSTVEYSGFDDEMLDDAMEAD